MASEIKVDTISEKTSANGVAIDGLTIKDGGLGGHDITFADGAYDFDIASHDTSNGLKLGGTLVTATAAELNIMDGVTATAAEINLIDGGTARGTTSLADGDGILINDAGTMRMTNVTTVKTYMSTSLDGIDDQTSSNDDQLTITDTAVVINEDGDDVDFRIEGDDNDAVFSVDGGLNSGVGLVGIGSSPDLGVGLHIKTADSGASVNAAGDELVIEGSGDSGMTILSGTSGSASIFFGDSGDNDIASVQYHHGSNYMQFNTNAAEAMRIDSNGDVGIGDTSPDSGRLNISTDHADGQGRIIYGELTSTSGTSANNGVLFSANSSNFTNQFFRLHMESPNANQKIIYCTTTSSNTEKFGVDEDGDVVSASNSYGATSDERIKQDIVNANSQWDDIKAVKVRNFKRKSDLSLTQIGVISQELEAAGMTGLVTERDPDVSDIEADSSFGTIVDDNSVPPYDYYEDGDVIPDDKEIGDPKTYKKKVGEINAQVKEVKYSVLYMKAIKALQEAQTRIETLEAKVAVLEG